MKKKKRRFLDPRRDPLPIYSTPVTLCPKCGEDFDCMSPLPSSDPEEQLGPPTMHDVTVCGYCGEILSVTVDRLVTKMTERLWWALPPHQREHMLTWRRRILALPMTRRAKKRVH